MPEACAKGESTMHAQAATIPSEHALQFELSENPFFFCSSAASRELASVNNNQHQREAGTKCRLFFRIRYMIRQTQRICRQVSPWLRWAMSAKTPCFVHRLLGVLPRHRDHCLHRTRPARSRWWICLKLRNSKQRDLQSPGPTRFRFCRFADLRCG